MGAIPLKIQEIFSILEMEIMQVNNTPTITWMTSIHEYIRKGSLPEDKIKERLFRYKAARIWSMIEFYIKEVLTNLSLYALMVMNVTTS